MYSNKMEAQELLEYYYELNKERVIINWVTPCR